MSGERVAVVGMACRYPDINSPAQLWENVLAGRRSFRRLPDERTRLDDYYSPDPAAPDRFYSSMAAVIDGWEFDRVKYRIAGSTFRSTDLTHWLALETAATALVDAGLPNGDGLDRATTGVIVGNTLTGEFTRANLLRLRWPYVRRTVGAALREKGWNDGDLAEFLNELETRYKAPFPPIDEDSLAGALANTIAGRICGYFDFGGGGFTVDGACSSSLLSVITACDALVGGRLDAAIAGGVDLSIDPFELIGFAKTGALATSEMRIYDQRSNGFWPGEGCGMLVLMRDRDAVAAGLRRYATLAGWGYSSDGRGGITRPEVDGYRRALRRAYAAAGFGLDSVGYLEGHGTGTAVGDDAELRALSEERRAGSSALPTAIGSIKGNIGHTKAASGVAGLLKAVLAVGHQTIPPATSHIDPHVQLLGDRPALRVPHTAELWPPGSPIRAGVSSMGFGGINAHVVVEQVDSARRDRLDSASLALVRSRQDCELLLFDADDEAQLRARIAEAAALAGRLSYAELTDLSVTLRHELAGRPIRAAVVAAAPDAAVGRLATLLTALDSEVGTTVNGAGGVFLGHAGPVPRIGFLFPGQGVPANGDGGAMRRRFGQVDELYREWPMAPADGDGVDTETAQPAIAVSSVAGLRVLDGLGIEASVAVGHSLGELTALHWAGAMSEQVLMRTAAARGRIMSQTSHGGGAMAGIGGPPEAVLPLLAGSNVTVAGLNGPGQTVVSGVSTAVEEICRLAVDRGLPATRLPVSHAFHSSLVAPAAEALRAHLMQVPFRAPAKRILSTVTGDVLAGGTDLVAHLTSQVLGPVRFAEAVGRLDGAVDLLLEVGPGHVLTGLVGELLPTVPTIALDTCGRSLSGLLQAVGAAYVLGADLKFAALYDDRFSRPLALDKKFRFLSSPAEQAPSDIVARPENAQSSVTTRDVEPSRGETNSLEVLRRLAAERAELPLDAVQADTRPLEELHLSSITIGQIVSQAAKQLGRPVPAVTVAFATATVAELAQLLDQPRPASGSRDRRPPAGIGPWVRAFSVDLIPTAAAGTVVAPSAQGEWQLFTVGEPAGAAPLRQALKTARLGNGVLLCLTPDIEDDPVPAMLAAAHVALALPAPARCVVVGGRRGAGALAKTLHLEAPSVVTTLITVTGGWTADLVDQIVSDVAATAGFCEVEYTESGVRTVPVLRTWTPPGGQNPDLLGRNDVLLVTGGGKGIAAECALTVARDSSAAVAVLGRSDPDTDKELAANLARMAAAHIRVHYVRADVTVTAEVKEAVNEIRGVLGPVTAVLHGAGHNEPLPLAKLDDAAFRRTLAPKIAGLDAVLLAVDPASLRLLVTFGSIIGRCGLPGQADYATANDWLAEATRRVGEAYPHCRCLALEWSLWSGTGMGERLGVLESFIHQGISPIRIEDGVSLLRQVLADPVAPARLVVMGRVSPLPTVTLERPDLPLLRFLERPRVHYPAIELVADADLSTAADPYLTDHRLDGEQLLPATLGMEAMAQAAVALTGHTGPFVLESVEFNRPVIVPEATRTTIRVAALADEGSVRTAIRSAETDFRADHFRANIRCVQPDAEPESKVPSRRLLPLDPRTDLYGSIMFQGPRFQRVLGYRLLHSAGCVAEVATGDRASWFAKVLPPDLTLGDPGRRDALMHAIQCCVPDATLVPVGIDRLYLADPAGAQSEQVTLSAVERSCEDDTYTYDLDVRDPSGCVVERWQGLRLRAIRRGDGSGPWHPILLGTYLERRMESMIGTALRCVIWPDAGQSASRRERTSAAVESVFGDAPAVRYRPGGCPELADGTSMSAAHAAGATFVVINDVESTASPVACDMETAISRPSDEWAGLLGRDQFALAQLLASERHEDLSLAGTRVWGAVECLRKAGFAQVDGLVVAEPRTDGWAVFRSGTARIATFATTLRGVSEPVVCSILSGGP